MRQLSCRLLASIPVVATTVAACVDESQGQRGPRLHRRRQGSSPWLDVASLSNNQYEPGHEISAFGAVRADQIEGILVVRKPAAVQ
jgi:hypothetical protein